jgi:8-oxo-dGTP pyrophosphatase MutT (NUDIX family)
MPISEHLRDLRQKVGNDPLLVPSVCAVIMDAAGQVLLMQSRLDEKWYLPGGATDPGEQPADAIVREVREETGLEVEPKRVIGVYAEEKIRYPNGDLVWPVTTAFACDIIGGKLGPNDDEAIDVRFFALAQLPTIPQANRAGDDRR